MLGVDLIPQVLALKRAPYEALLASGGGLRLALGVVFVAGLSQALGQSVVLFVNQVRPRRFVASLIVGAALYVIGFLYLVASIWFVARYGLGREQAFTTVVRGVGLAYAPYLLSFFVLTPYLGSFFSLLFSVWSLVAVLLALTVLLKLTLLQAALCSVVAWLLLRVAERTVGRPLRSVASFARQVAAGRPLEQSRARLRDLIRRGRRGE